MRQATRPGPRPMAKLTREEGAALQELFRRWLREHRFPVTRPRELVAEVIFTSEDHLSVEGIERRLRERGEHVGTATVYRTLDVMVQSGLVRAHDFGEGFKRYEPMPADAHHEHLVCLRCGRVTEFSNERLERMLHFVADEFQFQHQRHSIELYGLCRECRQRDLAPLTS